MDCEWCTRSFNFLVHEAIQHNFELLSQVSKQKMPAELQFMGVVAVKTSFGILFRRMGKKVSHVNFNVLSKENHSHSYLLDYPRKKKQNYLNLC